MSSAARRSLSSSGRRACVAALGLGLLGVGASRAQDPAARRLAVGVETSLQLSGLAPRLGAALARDTGLAIDWRAGPSGLLLPQLERGELDAAFTLAPELEASLLRQNLIHDRRPVAETALLLVGPAPRKATKKQPAQPDPAGVAALEGGPDIARALAHIAAAGQRAEAVYVAASEPSGVRFLEQALWKAAGPQAVGAWLQANGGGPAALLAQAAQAGGYALVERGVWAALGARHPGLAVLLGDDPRQRATAHLMRPFRAHHPAARLAVAWLAGPGGRRAVAGFGRGYRAAG
ncbi:LysR substrate-binding domain-containing protein [Methylibium sp.]|uniref:LysR substrate-binding domain-containing protein n=1 Tax=Methylibium sp. TaxID=2067992 RepID=UPI002DB61FBE|nr:substrate-binding domain-containing protein [Methylibium sp.]